MYKIGIIGRRDAVQGFMALGFAVREADSTADAARELHAMAKSQEYGVIFITENFATELEEEMAKYRDLPIPAIVSIPARWSVRSARTFFSRTPINGKES